MYNVIIPLQSTLIGSTSVGIEIWGEGGYNMGGLKYGGGVNIWGVKTEELNRGVKICSRGV